MGNTEYRFYKFSELRVKRTDDGQPVIEGHAAVFNKFSDEMWGFKEKIDPAAFKNALPNSDTRALFNHDPNIVLGRKSAGTLELKEDKEGLFMRTYPPDTQLVRDMVLTPIERGDIKEQSFGFIVASNGDRWEENKKTGQVTRTITEVEELIDVSPVTFPAYPDTDVQLNSKQVALRSLEEFRKGSGDTPPEPPANIPEEADEAKTAEIRTIVKTVLEELNIKPYEQPSSENSSEGSEGRANDDQGENPNESEDAQQKRDLWLKKQAEITETITKFDL